MTLVMDLLNQQSNF